MTPSLEDMNDQGAVPRHVAIRCDPEYEVVDYKKRSQHLRPISPVTQITMECMESNNQNDDIPEIGAIFINKDIKINKPKPNDPLTPPRRRTRRVTSRSPMRGTGNRPIRHTGEKQEFSRRPKRKEERTPSNNNNTNNAPVRERRRISQEPIRDCVPEISREEIINNTRRERRTRRKESLAASREDKTSSNDCRINERRKEPEDGRRSFPVEERRTIRPVEERSRTSSLPIRPGEERRREAEGRSRNLPRAPVEVHNGEPAARSSSFPKARVEERRKEHGCRSEHRRRESVSRPSNLPKVPVEERRRKSESQARNAHKAPTEQQANRRSSTTGYAIDPSSRLPPLVQQIKEARQVRKARGSSIASPFDIQSVSGQSRATTASVKTTVTAPPKFAYAMDSTPQILMNLGLVASSCDQQYEHRKTATSSSEFTKEKPAGGLPKCESGDQDGLAPPPPFFDLTPIPAAQEEPAANNEQKKTKQNKQGEKDGKSKICSSADVDHLLKVHSKQVKKSTNKGFGFMKLLSKSAK